MAHTYLILDKAKRMVAAHSWGGEATEKCPIVIPDGGYTVVLSGNAGVPELFSLMAGGQAITIEDQIVKVDGEPVSKIVDGVLKDIE